MFKCLVEVHIFLVVTIAPVLKDLNNLEGAEEEETELERIKREEKGQTAEDASLARMVLREKNLQKKEARTPPPHGVVCSG